MTTTKSPLKARRRRFPGQSLDERLKDQVFDELLVPWLLAVVSLFIALLEWLRVSIDLKPQPLAMSGIALLATCFAAYKFWRYLPKLKRLKLGREGEREVAEILNSLCESGYTVLHDLLGDAFNIDHVVVGPSGIYTVETKTRMKPRRGNAKVSYDGVKVLVAGRSPDHNPVVQARAQAGGLKAVLRESIGRDIQVRPVVVFPGWWVESIKGMRSDVWVLNPKGLVAFIKNEPELLSSQDIITIAKQLELLYSGDHLKR